MRTDHDVDAPVGEPGDHLLRLGVGGEPGEPLHGHRELRHPPTERRDMLLREKGCRREYHHLLAVLHRLECGADRDLGLSVADVAGDDPIHRHRSLHVGLDVVDGRRLVGCLGERERILQLALPGRVRAERVPGRRGPFRVQLHEFRGDLADRLAGLALRLRPVRAAELVERGHLAADVAGELVERVGGDVEPVARLAALARRVLDHQIVPDRAAGGALHHLDVLADPVLGVHHEIADLKRRRIDGEPSLARCAADGFRCATAVSSQVRLGDDGQARAGEDDTVVHMPTDHRHRAGGGGGDQGAVDQLRRNVRLGEHLDRP